jgi:hypothetical protein
MENNATYRWSRFRENDTPHANRSKKQGIFSLSAISSFVLRRLHFFFAIYALKYLALYSCRIRDEIEYVLEMLC